jgi:hypothetical protein
MSDINQAWDSGLLQVRNSCFADGSAMPLSPVMPSVSLLLALFFGCLRNYEQRFLVE